MIRIEKVLKRGLKTSFLCLLTFASSAAFASAKTTAKSTTEPDFAFPQTVLKDAAVNFKRAISSRNGEETLKAAVQMDISNALISASSFKKSAERFDSVSTLLPVPWSNLALMLEAKMYSQLYQSQARTFDGRKIPSLPVPDDVMEWSAEMFKIRVKELTLKALENSERLASIPISDIRGVLIDCNDAIKDNYSVLDFMTIQSADVLSPFANRGETNIIPFGKESLSDRNTDISSFIDTLITDAINRNLKRNNPAAASFFMERRLKSLSGKDYNDYARSCYEILKDTPYCVPFVLSYYSGISGYDLDADDKVRENITRRNKYDLLSEYLNKFPHARGIESVERSLESLREKNMEVSFRDKIISNRTDSIGVKGANIYDFYILIYSLPITSGDNSYKFKDIPVKGKLIDIINVKTEGEIPDIFEKSVALPPLKPGCYAFVPSSTKDLTGIIKHKEYYPLSTVLVSDINIISSNDRILENKDIFIVSASDNKPLENAKITLSEKNNKGNVIRTTTYYSDKDGKISFPSLNYDYLVEYKGNKYNGSFYNYRYRGGNEDRKSEKIETSGNIFTDLKIFHPGDTVRFAGVIYNKIGNRRFEPCRSKDINVRLYDANYQIVDSCGFKTDDYGRINGGFEIPGTGLLGYWHIGMYDEKNTINVNYIEVSDYKQPTFVVNVNEAQGNINIGDLISFKGNAVTYTGLPVSNGKVSYEVEYMPMWYSSNYGSGSFSGNTVTDLNGNFNIELNTEGLKNSRYDRGMFYLTVSVTDNAGETQSSRKVRFVIGEFLRIINEIPEKLEAGKGEVNLNVKVVDAINHPIVKKVNYEIISEGKTIESGEFDSPNFRFDPSRLASGKYDFRFSIDKDTISSPVIIWRTIDKMPPVKTLLWVDSTLVVAPKGSKLVKIRVGSSYPGNYVLAQICNTQKIICYKWLNIKDGFVEIDVESPTDDEQIFVNLIATDDFIHNEEHIRIIPYYQTVSLKVNVETFRDNISPGDREKWRFSYSSDGKRQPMIPVISSLTDKAINSLGNNEWGFNPFGSLNWLSISNINCNNINYVRNRIQLPSNIKYSISKRFNIPQWQLYGYSLIADRGYSSRVYRKSAAKTSAGGTVTNLMATRDAVPEYGADRVESSVVTEESANDSMDYEVVTADDIKNDMPKEEVRLRDSNLAVAFFKPSLCTDSEGNAIIEFEAPDFIGTWMFQILAYNNEMKGSVLNLDAVSSKKVMAVLNAPRFARTGDLLNVAANVFNNSTTRQSVGSKIEFINAISGELLYAYSPAATLVDPSKSCTVNAEFKIPSGLEAMVIRVYGEIEGYKDGEQVIIPILPSSTPIIESTPFYIEPSQNEFELKLPKYDKDARLTLTYCDNPVWECVTALPSIIKPESVNILAHVRALFANCVASGLFEKYPELSKAVVEMAEKNDKDSTLYSPLMKNASLKTVLLNNTPWVNDAQSESIRMQNLIKYTDDQAAENAVESIIKTLKERQNANGGWGWCPDMKSSSYITMGVFATLSQIENMGYLPSDARDLAFRAYEYIDNSLAEDWNKAKRKSYSLLTLLDYLYSKSAFGKMNSTPQFSPLEKIALKDIESKWRDLDIYHKATAAILLERRGLKQTSRLILESLRQFASESPEKGMWFDNLNSGWSGMNTLMTTSRVLEAFAFIEPQNTGVIDKLRQWLVISKQTQNWGDRACTAEAINAILTSGTEWTSVSTLPTVDINGTSLDLGNVSAITGSFTVNLNTREAGGKTMTIRRTGKGPAWGGVISQYQAPITDVKAASVPQLSVKKNLFFLDKNDKTENAENIDMEVGNKVRITLTIVCDRDLEYVVITDPRAACLEPADQLSGYTSSDGVWFYREVRNEATNLFIPFLAKGTHVISYECYVDRSGEYSVGVANAQSQYAPSITAHSAGMMIEVNK